MPEGKKHHTEKFRSCVEKVMAQGKDESSAYAICTTSLQEAGEPIFEAASEHEEEDLSTTVRTLHLRTAVGKAPRMEFWNGKEHLVVPCVALQEGVIHAVNADTPEFVSAQVLAKSHGRWNGHPLVVGHPTRNGKQVSAHAPDLIEKHGFGFIRTSCINGKKLGLEALVDPSRLLALGQKALLADLRDGRPVELSVGAFVTTNNKSGNYNGKDYQNEWVEITPDHLAFLPGGRGACSLEMGCGAHRAASEFVDTQEIQELWPDSTEFLRVAAGARNSASDLAIIQDMHDRSVALGATCDPMNTRFMADKKTEEITTAAKKNYKDCVVCGGTGSKDGNPCEACDGKGQMKVAAAIEPESKAASCRCKGEDTMAMSKDKKAELIAALVTDNFSGFKEGDEPFLETLADGRLEELRTASATRKSEAEARTKLENEQRATAARLKVAEEKVKASERSLTEEEWKAAAPPGIKTLLERQEKQDIELKESLVAKLRTAQSEYTEDELKAMELPQLERLGRAIKPEQKDYTGRGLPRMRGAADSPIDAYAPPDPYEAPLKALQKNRSVN